jgi:hypothetical protein
LRCRVGRFREHVEKKEFVDTAQHSGTSNSNNLLSTSTTSPSASSAAEFYAERSKTHKSETKLDEGDDDAPGLLNGETLGRAEHNRSGHFRDNDDDGRVSAADANSYTAPRLLPTRSASGGSALGKIQAAISRFNRADLCGVSRSYVNEVGESSIITSVSS